MYLGRITSTFLVFSAWCQVVLANPASLEFTLHKHQTDRPGPTLLVIGGIQGDEPGGFTAASLLVTDYKIMSGNVWVVPNLNFLSIVNSSRGVHGDMNRKFSQLHKTDPEYNAVQKIKSIILDEQVDIILNLHDGSGFYSATYIDRLRNPQRWGQTVIIDQEEISSARFSKLGEIARRVVNGANPHLEQKYRYAVKNTRTREGDKEMEKSLTYFAIQNNKPAFGVEASKNFLTHQRSFFHLQIVESFMKDIGIEFERPFELSVASVKKRIDNNVQLSLFDRRVFFDMADARRYLGFVPFKKNAPLDVAASNPLVAVIDEKSHYRVRYGNRHVALLKPQYFEYDESLQSLPMQIDGESTQVEFGRIIDVVDGFSIDPLEDHRTNIIGYYKKGIHDESGIKVTRKDILKRYSVDNDARIFRVELYKGKRFCGMILVRFIDNAIAGANTSSDKQSHSIPFKGEG